MPALSGGSRHEHSSAREAIELIVLGPVAVALALIVGLPERLALWLPVLGLVLVAMVVACVYLQAKTRDWQRFRRHDGK